MVLKEKFKIAFRVDSSTQIGSGHLMRCLTLAEKLNCQEKIIFISRNLSGNISNLVLKKGFKLILLKNEDLDLNLRGYEKWLTVRQEQDAKETIEAIKNLNLELLIVDSYAIDVKWEKMLRPSVKKIMVIDDLANRKHDCDILLDQNFYLNGQNRYEELVGKDCKLLLGPEFVLLRDEFYEERNKKRNNFSEIKNIFIFFGGSDLTNDTMKTLKAIFLLKSCNLKVNVVVGNSNIYKKEIEMFCNEYCWITYYCQVDNIAELMSQADLAIGAGGTATWERCYLGLPTIVISVAENQRQLALDAHKIGIIKYLGSSDNVSVNDIFEAITYFISNKVEYYKVKSKITELVKKWKKKDYKKLLLLER